MSKMNSAVKKMWTAALRSGKYDQGKSALALVDETNTKYCCLGVLCELAVDAGVIGAGAILQNGGNSSGTMAYGAGRDTSTLPDEVIQWAEIGDGVYSSNPYVEKANGQKNSLATINDRGTSFEEIADLIEENL